MSPKTCWRCISEAGERAGVEKVHHHRFRHHAAKLRKDAGVPIEDVAAFMRHYSAVVTELMYYGRTEEQINHATLAVK